MNGNLIINGIDFGKRLEAAKLLVQARISESYDRELFWRTWYDLGIILHTKEHYEYHRRTIFTNK